MSTQTHDPGSGVTLHSRAADGLSLREALTHARVSGGVALLSTPAAFVVATLHDDGRCTTADGGTADPEEAFEARVFTPYAELRWYDNSPGTSRAVVLAEDPALLPGDPFNQPVPELCAVEVLESRYLLWGRLAGTNTETRWTSWSTSRVGTLELPGPPAGLSHEDTNAPDPASVSSAEAVGEARMHLIGREYVCTEQRHGNAHIAEERLLGLRIARPEQLGEAT